MTTLKDAVMEELNRPGAAVAIQRIREAHGLSRNQVADALGIMPNDVWRAEKTGGGSRSCPDAYTLVRGYLYGLMGIRPAGDAGGPPEPAADGSVAYEKGDLVHVTGLEGVWRYQYHGTSTSGVVSVTVYGGPKHYAQFRTIKPEQLGRIIRKRKQGEEE